MVAIQALGYMAIIAHDPHLAMKFHLKQLLFKM
jgi:hypothetical protein